MNELGARAGFRRLFHKNRPSGKTSKSSFLEGPFDQKFAEGIFIEESSFWEGLLLCSSIKCESSFWEGPFRGQPNSPIFMEQPPGSNSNTKCILLTREDYVGAVGFRVLLVERLPALHQHPLDGKVHGPDVRTEVADDGHGEVEDDVRVPLHDLANVERTEDGAPRSLHRRVREEGWLSRQHLRSAMLMLRSFLDIVATRQGWGRYFQRYRYYTHRPTYILIDSKRFQVRMYLRYFFPQPCRPCFIRTRVVEQSPWAVLHDGRTVSASGEEWVLSSNQGPGWQFNRVAFAPKMAMR